MGGATKRQLVLGIRKSCGRKGKDAEKGRTEPIEMGWGGRPTEGERRSRTLAIRRTGGGRGGKSQCTFKKEKKGKPEYGG